MGEQRQKGPTRRGRVGPVVLAGTLPLIVALVEAGTATADVSTISHDPQPAFQMPTATGWVFRPAIEATSAVTLVTAPVAAAGSAVGATVGAVNGYRRRRSVTSSRSGRRRKKPAPHPEPELEQEDHPRTRKNRKSSRNRTTTMRSHVAATGTAAAVRRGGRGSMRTGLADPAISRMPARPGSGQNHSPPPQAVIYCRTWR